MRVGFLLRRLALVVEPQPDESFASWVDRMPVVDNRRVTGAQCAGAVWRCSPTGVRRRRDHGDV